MRSCKLGTALVLAAAVLGGCGHTQAAPQADPVKPVEPTPALGEPMAKLGFMRGIWIGPAEGTLPDGSTYKVMQTERMGPMLGGDIIVIEGRGYKEDGSTGFNAFGVVSFNQVTKKYEMRSYAMGYGGTFELTPTENGYVWEIPAGQGAIMRYTATVKDGHWREVGEYIATGKPPAKVFEMNLEHVSDTHWPLGTPVTPDDKK